MQWMSRSGRSDPTALPKEDAPAVKKLREVDRENTAWLRGVVDRTGWPGRGRVGPEGANAAWLLVQHADRDRAFQKRCLALMEEAARNGEASRQGVAYLTDRVLVGEHQKQRYGTQTQARDGKYVPYPIEDEAGVDRRRAEVGLPPLEQYLKQVNEMYQQPSVRPAK